MCFINSPSLPDVYIFTILIYRNVNNFGFGNADYLTVRHSEAFGFDDDFYRDRSVADFGRRRVKADEIADENGLVKDNFLHRDGHETIVSRSANGFDTAGDVDVT